MERPALRALAEYYRASGADVIDVGCTPGRPFPGLRSVVRELRDADLRVSVDSFDREEIRTALDAGAEMVLSVNASNIDIVEPHAGDDRRFVVIPDTNNQFTELKRNLKHLNK